MKSGLRGRSVLITGASRNMGRTAALLFAAEGANLAICTSAKVDELKQVAAEASALGSKVVAEKCDVTEPGDVQEFVTKVCERLGGIDVAINLAGYRCEQKFLEIEEDIWDRAIAVNLTGPLNICRSVLPVMMKRRWGRIINISGISPFIGGAAAKAMVKYGIVGFTRGLAKEFGQYNITANCIGPGVIERPPEVGVRQKPLRLSQPIPRKGTPEEAMSLAIYLASEGAGFITGQCYLVNGGLYFQ